jgi:hypothetical protein
MTLSPEPRESTEYIQPEVVDYGDLAELTAGTQLGSNLDGTFPISTRRRGGGGGGFSVTLP